jgi:hypothetical protein
MMLKRTVSLLITISIFSIGILPVLAQTDSWNDVKTISNQEVAVKKKNGETVYGSLVSADDSGIVVRLANKTGIGDASTTIARSDISKLWLATLKFRGRQTLRGALYGAAIGAGAGAIIYSQVPRNESTDGLEVLVVPMAVGIGAGVGTLAGFFTKKGHKKGKLIYKASS